MNSVFNEILSEAIPTVELAQRLVRLDTTNPPGNETRAADLIAARLQALGIAVERYELAPGRVSVVARTGSDGDRPALCLCGHLDTVPLGTEPWLDDPLSGDIRENRIWGRGSSDMKCGVAAMVTAFERLHREGSRNPVVLALCASEETGCQGAAQIADKLGPVGALVIAEPTAGEIAIGHKGVLWLKLVARGKAAHGSMPHLGINAIDAMTDALQALRDLNFEVPAHPLLGVPTRNVGTISGGSATNVVPDRCECMLDIRLVPGLTAVQATALVAACVEDSVAIETIIALDAVASDPEDTWIGTVIAANADIEARDLAPICVSYFTDASVLAPAFRFPPVVIVGPGDPSLAHQVNESCSVPAIWRASQLYERLARGWAA